MNTDYLDYDDYVLIDRRKPKTQLRKRREMMLSEDGFRCMHCHAYVVSYPQLAGVQHRNHCPYCLWSRHLDLNQAGDRMSACKSPMEPLGLSMKRIQKKYASMDSGELMIIHRCLDCEKISANRIAADDDIDQMLEIFNHSLNLSRNTKLVLETSGIMVLDSSQEKLVHLRLLGN